MVKLTRSESQNSTRFDCSGHMAPFRAKNLPKVGLCRPRTMPKQLLNSIQFRKSFKKRKNRVLVWKSQNVPLRRSKFYSSTCWVAYQGFEPNMQRSGPFKLKQICPIHRPILTHPSLNPSINYFRIDLRPRFPPNIFYRCTQVFPSKFCNFTNI